MYVSQTPFTVQHIRYEILKRNLTGLANYTAFMMCIISLVK